MKKILLFCLAIALSRQASAQSELPTVQLLTLKGETINTRSLLRDSVPIVVSFWSTFCKPCLEELNAFSDLWDDWQKDVKFKIVAVATDDARTMPKVAPLVAGHDWPFTILLDKNQDFKRAFNVNGIPHLYIISAEGKVVYARIGYTPGAEQKVLEILKELK